MKGIIWYYTNKSVALEKLQSIANEYKKIGIEVKLNISTYNNCLLCSNGDIWSTAFVSDCARGQACNVGLIEYGTPEDIIHEIIMPCIKAFPYRAYNYY